MSKTINLTGIVDIKLKGCRLDKALSVLFPEYSREKLKSWVVSGECLVDGENWRPKDKVTGEEVVVIIATEAAKTEWLAEDILIDKIYEDPDILVINKSAGLVVHPAAGNESGTLVNALLYSNPDLINLPRAGIVHRSDKDTTGLMVVAKNLIAHNNLVEQLQNRTVTRIYEAVVWGHFVAGGTVDEPIGRHPTNRIKMAVNKDGKPAVTHYRVLAKFNQMTHLQVTLETGRTHQIRVHMAHINHSIVGDPIYVGRARSPANSSQDLREFLTTFTRQALHAKQLSLCHPVTNKLMSWEAPLPNDFQRLLILLKDN